MHAANVRVAQGNANPRCFKLLYQLWCVPQALFLWGNAGHRYVKLSYDLWCVPQTFFFSGEMLIKLFDSLWCVPQAFFSGEMTNQRFCPGTK